MKRLIPFVCVIGSLLFILSGADLLAQKSEPAFKVIGFFTIKNDKAHISFVHEAKR